jgi:hypothetical protein
MESNKSFLIHRVNQKNQLSQSSFHGQNLMEYPIEPVEEQRNLFQETSLAAIRTTAPILLLTESEKY